jgi:hypothetical protein
MGSIFRPSSIKPEYLTPICIKSTRFWLAGPRGYGSACSASARPSLSSWPCSFPPAPLTNLREKLIKIGRAAFQEIGLPDGGGGSSRFKVSQSCGANF